MVRQANTLAPKKRQWQPTKKHQICAKIFRQPLGRFDFPLGYPWRLHRKQHIRKENSANPNPALRGRRCTFPLKCGQNTKTTAGHLMTMGALEPSFNITEQANRRPWLLYTMMQHTSARRVPPPSLLSACIVTYSAHTAHPAHDSGAWLQRAAKPGTVVPTREPPHHRRRGY